MRQTARSKQTFIRHSHADATRIVIEIAGEMDCLKFNQPVTALSTPTPAIDNGFCIKRP